MKKKVLSIVIAFVATAATAQENSINGHEYVNLGLKSGTLWATCNVGASNPEDYGEYYAWGETTIETKEEYTWNDYKWCKGSEKTLTKYCSKSEYGDEGFTDDPTTLLPEDDAATANWGGKWRMPTKADIDELLAQTTDEWTTVNGVKGHKFTAKNGSGNFIFFPSAGYKYSISSKLFDDGNGGICWSSSLNESNPAYAYYLVFNTDTDKGWYNVNRHNGPRQWGLSVRPVISKDDISTGIEYNNRETITNNDWYSIDGKRLSGKPTQKGVYIVNGKKVVK